MIVLQRKGLRALALNLGIFGLLAGESLVCAAEQREGRENTARQALPIDFDIPAQPLDTAVQTLAQQAGVQVLFDRQLLQGLRSTELKQTLGLEAALQHLLGGNAVRYRFTDAQQLTLTPLPASNGAVELELTDITGIAYQPDDWVYQAPRSVSLISREQIDKRPPRHAADMLEETPGVYTAVNQRDPGLSVNIRGVQDYGRVNMNIDGMRQNFNVNGHQQRNGTMLVDPEMLSGVQIDKGSQSGMGGAGVLGGIATFRTWEASDFLTADKEYGGRLRAGHGLGAMGNGTYFNGSGVVAVGNEVGDLLVGVSERHFGNYTAGQNNDKRLDDKIRGWGREKFFNDWLASEIGESGSVARSQMFKFGLHLPRDQRVQVSYLRTDADSKNSWAWSDDEGNYVGYKLTGRDNLSAHNYSLDYTYTPDSTWIDTNAKLYFVRTQLKRWGADNGRSLDSGNHLPEYNNFFQTSTWGLQVGNDSRFDLGSWGALRWSQGIDIYEDRSHASTDHKDQPGKRLPYVEAMNPKGIRTVAGVLTGLDYEFGDWLKVEGGVRYDQARLQGKTGNTYWAPTKERRKYQRFVEIYDVDRQSGHFLPTLSVGVKPGVDWLEVYGKWGRGARTPVATETFMSGPPHAGGSEFIYANPFLKDERSRDWELGLNVFKQSLFTSNDRLAAKIAYFNTRIDNFIYTAMGVNMPGTGVNGLGDIMAVNNLRSARFRGFDYKLNYDAGRVYGDFVYTQMIGSNKFCSRSFPLGGALKSLKNPVTGEYGYIDDAVGNSSALCDNIFGNASYMPVDRGAVTLGSRYFDRKLDVGVRYKFSDGSGSDITGFGNVGWPEYGTYDVFASAQLSKQLGVIFVLENATDETYFVGMADQENLSLAKGRTLTGTVQYSF